MHCRSKTEKATLAVHKASNFWLAAPVRPTVFLKMCFMAPNVFNVGKNLACITVVEAPVSNRASMCKSLLPKVNGTIGRRAVIPSDILTVQMSSVGIYEALVYNGEPYILFSELIADK